MKIKNALAVFRFHRLALLRKIVFILFLLSCSYLPAQVPPVSILQQKAPEKFKAVFKTTKGDFIIEVYRNWSPKGADRLYQLIGSGYYDNNLFFRVEKNFVAQFGIASADAVNRFWYNKRLPDEPARQKNTKGMISFARGTKNDRSTQLFINLSDNPKLDTALRGGTRGFTPVAKIISGMKIAASLNGKYGKQPAVIQDSLYIHGNKYFEKKFPGLDRIIHAQIIK